MSDTARPVVGITAKGVYVTYRNGQTALRDASFEVPTGTIT
ncbi:MAG: manganese/iron ABC transporter ATP-binding protein, partial [Albidovulum sp.]